MCVLLLSRMSESAVATFGLVKRVDGQPFSLFEASDDELGYAIAVIDSERFGREVDHDDAYLAAIVGIDGARSVEQRDAMFEGEARAGAHLSFVAFGQCDAQPCWHQSALHGLQGDRLIDVGSEVKTRTLSSGILRQVVVRMVDYLDFHC